MSLKKLLPEKIKMPLRRFRNDFPFRVVRLRSRPKYHAGRFEYQQRYVRFDISPGEKVLDIGSGGDPFPYATVLMDRYLEQSNHRNCALATNGKPLMVADLQDLPLSDKSMDFIYCSHVLEHVDSPIKGCQEIMRVGKRGFIETPNFGKDALFAWAKNMHKWHLSAIGDTICFFEYSKRQLKGINCTDWSDMIFSRWHHPIQQAFYENQDVFNILFDWHDKFNVYVFYQDGRIETIGN